MNYYFVMKIKLQMLSLFSMKTAASSEQINHKGNCYRLHRFNISRLLCTFQKIISAVFDVMGEV